jgi:hypothetical protein
LQCNTNTLQATPRLPCDTPGKVSELRAAEIDRNMHLYPYDAYHSKLPAAAIAPAGSAPASSSTSTTTTSSVAATTAPPLPGPMQYQARSLPAHFGGAYADLPSDEQWTNPSMRITDWHAAKKKQMHGRWCLKRSFLVTTRLFVFLLLPQISQAFSLSCQQSWE